MKFNKKDIEIINGFKKLLIKQGFDKDDIEKEIKKLDPKRSLKMQLFGIHHRLTKKILFSQGFLIK